MAASKVEFSMYKGTKVPGRTKQSLSYIQATRPELFAHQGACYRKPADEFCEIPPGFEPCAATEYLYHADRKAYFEKTTGRFCWYNASTGNYETLRFGQRQAIVCSAGAALFPASCGKSSGSSSSSSSSSSTCGADGRRPAKQPKTVVIPDLHRVGQALKIDLEHLDRPAAFLGAFLETSEGVVVDVVARGLHEKLVKRLGLRRGELSDLELLSALRGAFQDITGGQRGVPAVAVAMTLGRRVVGFSTPGAHIQLSLLPSDIRSPLTTNSSGSRGAALVGAVAVGTTVAAADTAKADVCPAAESEAAEAQDFCFVELTPNRSEAVSIVAMVGLQPSDAAAVFKVITPHLQRGRPRAACISLLRAATQAHDHTVAAFASSAVACARLGPPLRGNAAAAAVVGAGGEERIAKRLRTSDEVPSKVRIRQILLRYWRGEGPQPVEPRHRKLVSRSPEEAEAELLAVLEGLKDDGGGFTAACRAVSECQAALKGGELAGDLGWLSTANLKGTKPDAKHHLPMAVLKVAFELDVNEMSDIVSSEIGAHLLLRTA